MMTGMNKKNQNSPVGSPDNISDGSSKEQDRFLPIANVSRIMKKSLPANAKISKEAKETVQECVSEFISFITGEASDKCLREKRKTINGDDLLWSMTTLGFENYVGPLKLHLNKYSETEEEDTGKEDDIPSFGQGEKGKHFDSQTKNLGFYPLGAKLPPNGYGDHEKVMAYGDNMMTSGFTLGKLRDIEDTSASHISSTWC